MSGAGFADLHGKSLAVSLEIGERTVVFKGVGSINVDDALGTVLRIPIHDPAGVFEFVLSQKDWHGEILTGVEFECDYFLVLGSHCLAAVGSC